MRRSSIQATEEIIGIFQAMIDTVEDVADGLAGLHLRIMLSCAACQEGDPSNPRSHDHGRCRAVTGRRVAEALWTLFDEVHFNGPSPTERIIAALTAMHEALGTETELRRQIGRQ